MSSTPSTSNLLTYPSPSPKPAPAPQALPAPSPLLKDRLYVGNLHPTVDEYTLLQLFSKHGKVSKLDFLFHKTGPAKGKPRGYAFIEYSSKDDALRALVAMHDRLVRGRRLVVTFAHQAPQIDSSGRPSRRLATDTSKPTALSLLKTHNRPGATKDKIAALEAKLRQMEQTPSSAPLTILPSSLPQKPLLNPMPTVSAEGAQRKPGMSASGSILPSKTMPSPTQSLTKALHQGASLRPSSRRRPSSSLGVVIKR